MSDVKSRPSWTQPQTNWLSSIKTKAENKQTEMKFETPAAQTWNGSSQPGPAVIKANSQARSFMWGPSHVPLSASRPKHLFPSSWWRRKTDNSFLYGLQPTVKLRAKSVIANNLFLLSRRCHNSNASVTLVLFGREKDESESNCGLGTLQNYGPEKISDLLLLGIYLPSAKKITDLQVKEEWFRLAKFSGADVWI